MAEPAASLEPPAFPNKLGRIALLAYEEVVGHNGLNAVLNRAGLGHWINNYPPGNYDAAFPFSDLAQIQRAAEELYGPRGGRGLALRAGRACFKHGLREFGTLLGVSDLTFRLLPLNMKMKVGAEVFARTLDRLTGQGVRLEETAETMRWVLGRCPICWGRKSEAPCCHLAIGVVQEALYWVSGGKNFLVEEVACTAKGDPTCVIQVDRQPVD